MKTEKPITIEVDVDSPYSAFCLAWVYDGARCHVWLDRATKKLEQRILFKNSIPNRGEAGYFECRKLRVDISRNGDLIGLVMHMAAAGDLFNKAEQKMRDKEADEQRAREQRQQQKRIEERAAEILAAFERLVNATESFAAKEGYIFSPAQSAAEYHFRTELDIAHSVIDDARGVNPKGKENQSERGNGSVEGLAPASQQDHAGG